MDAIKNQREKQLDVIERQKENKPKMIEKDQNMYLEDKTDKLFDMYPKFVNKQSKTLLNTPVKNENKINYKNLSYKILLLDGTFHEISFLKKYGFSRS